MSNDGTTRRDEQAPLSPEVAASIKRLYGPLAEAEPPPIADAPVREKKRSALRITGLAAAAAVVVLSLLVAHRVLSPARLDAGAMYARYIASFEPTYVCDTPGSFRQYSARKVGVPIDADYGSGVTFVGWRTPDEEFVRSGRADKATTMYATSDAGVGLLVIFNGDARLPPGSDLNVFEGDIGGVRVLEISPLDAPAVLPLMTSRVR